ncbi:hypothetical protein P692DRAFT_20879047 [Suillus brevipes Sb2]|nr:hypothetical protein P692DRAFT_20879047 [Suillus brevipes Sb2]
MCAPHLGEDSYTDLNPESIPTTWSDHFDAIAHLNSRILPSFKFSPRELLLGLVIDTPRTPTHTTVNQVSPTEVHVHSAYVAQQRLNALAHRVADAIHHKAVFDKKVHLSPHREVIFAPGQLVQVYTSKTDNTFKTSEKSSLAGQHHIVSLHVTQILTPWKHLKASL